MVLADAFFRINLQDRAQLQEQTQLHVYE
jgi:hypothetical protein